MSNGLIDANEWIDWRSNGWEILQSQVKTRQASFLKLMSTSRRYQLLAFIELLSAIAKHKRVECNKDLSLWLNERKEMFVK